MSVIKPTYLIQEYFTSIQGEGYFTGLPSHFLRFSGCNLSCDFCDTNHIEGAKRLNIPTILKHLEALRAKAPKVKHLVLTGGEPMLQINEALLDALREADFHIQIETNGTIIPDWLPHATLGLYGIWVTCSPKPGFSSLMLKYAQEFKILVGLDGPRIPPALKLAMNCITSKQSQLVYFQPISYSTKDKTRQALQQALKLVYATPHSKLSPQLHKLLNVR